MGTTMIFIFWHSFDGYYHREFTEDEEDEGLVFRERLDFGNVRL